MFGTNYNPLSTSEFGKSGKYLVLAQDERGKVTRVYDDDFSFVYKLAKKAQFFVIFSMTTGIVLCESASDVADFTKGMLVFKRISMGKSFEENGAGIHIRDNGDFMVREYRGNTVHWQTTFKPNDFEGAFQCFESISEETKNARYY